MNRYDDLYDIRIAQDDDKPSIMDFIGEHWRKDHLFATSEAVFDYYFSDGRNINFLVAISKQEGDLHAIVGFIWSSIDAKKRDAWATFWGADRVNAAPLLGVELLRRLKNVSNCRRWFTIGDSPDTSVQIIGRLFNRRQLKLKRYYLLNPLIKDYKIASVYQNDYQKDVKYKSGGRLIPFSSFELLSSNYDILLDGSTPYKDLWYIKHRYYDYPWIRYNIFGIESHSGDVDALVVFKEVSAVGTKALQLIDFFGNQQSFLDAGKSIIDYLMDNSYEYVDFYEYGFEDAVLKEMGFFEQTGTDPNIIPDYFEPFMKKSNDIWVSFEPGIAPTFFKGDGDLDRPRILN